MINLKKSAFILLFSLFLYSCGESVEKQVQKDMQEINVQVAADAVEQYNIANSSGQEMDRYVAAGMVAAAFLQAKDEENYKKWKAIELQHGKNLGL